MEKTLNKISLENMNDIIPPGFTKPYWVNYFATSSTIKNFTYTITVALEDENTPATVYVEAVMTEPQKEGNFETTLYSWLGFKKEVNTNEEAFKEAEAQLANVKFGAHFQPSEGWQDLHKVS